MKKLVLSLVASLVLASCAAIPEYYQIATVSSNDVIMQPNGKMQFSEKDIQLTYDFWSNGGEMSFTVTNLSDTDILFDVVRSYFICNGIANDYDSGNITNNICGESSVKYCVLPSDDFYQNNMGIIIPAYSSKCFKEFKILSDTYRQCGLARNPKPEETSGTVMFNAENATVSFENRLWFWKGVEPCLINNKFYVSEFSNKPRADVIVTTIKKNCDGQQIGTETYNKYYASNRFYSKYSFSDSNFDNDRLKNPKKQPVVSKTEDVVEVAEVIDENVIKFNELYTKAISAAKQGNLKVAQELYVDAQSLTKQMKSIPDDVTSKLKAWESFLSRR